MMQPPPPPMWIVLLVLSLSFGGNTLAIEQIRGISLGKTTSNVKFIFLSPSGGHLVPEAFIVPDLFETISNQYCPGAKDIWSICQCTFENQNYSSPGVIPLMSAHLRSFIDLTDLENKIKKTDINAIRYPISFTYFLDPVEDPLEFKKYDTCGVTKDALLQSSFSSILQLAQKLNVRVILDLHQVQGCQNGFDNGGHAGTRDFFNSTYILKGINIWANLIQYLKQQNLLSLIWGFEILNEPLPFNEGENALLQQFTELVVRNIISPLINPNQVIVLQPGPGNALVSAYENYNLPSNLTYVFDFHEYIVFGGNLQLTTMGANLPIVQSLAATTFGATKYPYFVGEWSLATTDCAQYLNGAFGGFDPNYYQKQHASRTTFNCNLINQIRDGFTVGFQTCSVILNSALRGVGDFPSCDAADAEDVFKQYRGALCKLFTTYLTGFAQGNNNVGFVFWTFTTGAGTRRIQQWDYAWAVDNNIIASALDPTPVDQCDNVVL